ncbi:hypothetical protein [Peribacillus sp. Hz7]|uniref:hypothetical protein n=1 Tax=Peribacillus sp. Hz7 TaxID=3344873 RepID=UPI0035CB84D7
MPIRTKSAKLNKVLNSFPLFAKNMIYIVDNNNEKVKFELNSAQLELEDLMEKNRFVNVSKARQRRNFNLYSRKSTLESRY